MVSCYGKKLCCQSAWLPRLASKIMSGYKNPSDSVRMKGMYNTLEVCGQDSLTSSSKLIVFYSHMSTGSREVKNILALSAVPSK